MEELKELIDLISKLPELAIWVLVAFWVYKVFVVGSIYGVIRLFIIHLFNWLQKDKTIVTKYQLGDVFLTENDKNEFAEALKCHFNTNNPSREQVRELTKKLNKTDWRKD